MTISINLFTEEFKEGEYRYRFNSDGSFTLTHAVLTYDTYITDDDFLNGNELTKEYTNKVEWGDEYTHQNIEVKRDVIGKSGSYDEATGTLQYAVMINPDGSDLNPLGDLIKVVDKLSNTNGLHFKLGEVSLFTIAINQDTKEFVPGAFIEQLKPIDKLPESFAEAKPNTYYYDATTNTITAYIEDNHDYALVYSYQIEEKLANDVTIGNEAKLYGEKTEYGGTTQWTKVCKSSSSMVVSSDAIGVLLEKRDSSYHDKKLGGAIFQLYRWDNTTGAWNWEAQDTYTTRTATENEKESVTGTVYIVQTPTAPDKNPQKNKVYCLEEIEAPQGYVLSKEKKYFVFTDDKEAVVIPDGLSEDDILWYEYKNGNVATLTWYNDREGTSLTVKKKWQNSEGSEITRNHGEVTFDLYRRATPIGAEVLPVRVLSEEELKEIENSYTAFYQKHKQEYVGTYTINPQQNHVDWSLTIDNLPKLDEKAQNQYQYYLVETKATTDSDNDEWLGVTYEADYDMDSEQGTITITNKISSAFTLPETGGKGTLIERLVRWIKELFGH